MTRPDAAEVLDLLVAFRHRVPDLLEYLNEHLPDDDAAFLDDFAAELAVFRAEIDAPEEPPFVCPPGTPTLVPGVDYDPAELEYDRRKSERYAAAREFQNRMKARAAARRMAAQRGAR